MITFCGSRGAVVRVHGQNTCVDLAPKPWGLFLSDSILDHEVLSPDDAARAVDDKGRHAPRRISVVFMANIQTHKYQTPEWIGHNHDRLCREQTARGVVPTRKRTAGGTTSVPSRSRQKQKHVESGSREM